LSGEAAACQECCEDYAKFCHFSVNAVSKLGIPAGFLPPAEA
jgi:hypothetical protein